MSRHYPRAIGDEPGDLEPTAAVQAPPERASWESGLPVIRGQYEDESCASWASAYYAMTAVKLFRRLGIKPEHSPHFRARPYVRDPGIRGRHVFSPSWPYNLLKQAKTWTESAAPTLELLRTHGAVHWYTNKEHVGDPKGLVRPWATQEGLANRISSFGYFDPSDSKRDWKRQVKWWIANHSPVLFEFYIYDSFLHHDHDPTPMQRVDGDFRDSHVMACVGYDDRKGQKKSGLFRFVNSWGADWADDGLAWVGAEAIEKMCDVGLRAWGFKLARPGEEAATPPAAAPGGPGT